MGDDSQMRGRRPRQFGDRMASDRPGEDGGCAECEAMLTDALDGLLGAAEQATFEEHVKGCDACGQLHADASRGAALLGMLREARPEPPPELLERIFSLTSAQTSVQGSAQASAQTWGQGSALAEAQMGMAAGQAGAALAAGRFAGGHAGGHAGGRGYGGVRPTLAARVGAMLRGSSLGHVLFQPRFAMTSAMAFFSIALTMNLTGVRVRDLRLANLRPSSLRRTFYSANARVVQYYEGLRVVYELESRVHDYQNASDPEAAPMRPAATGGGQDGTRPQPAEKKARPAPGSGSSSSGASRAVLLASGAEAERDAGGGERERDFAAGRGAEA